MRGAFVMDLQAEDLGRYQSRSIVTSYVRNRVIGWSPGPVNEQPFGHTYTLPPDGQDRTWVTQTYDWSAVTDPRLRGQFPRVSPKQLARTLDLLDETVDKGI